MTNAELAAQIDQAKQAGVGGTIVALALIDQSWSPRIVPHKPEAPAKESSASPPTSRHP